MKLLLLGCAVLFCSTAEAGLFWSSGQARSGGGFLGMHSKTVEGSMLDVPAVRSLQEEGSVDMVNKTLPQPKASNAAAPTAPQNATAGMPRSAATARKGSREESLISSLQHMDDGEVRHSWTECLEECVENRLKLSEEVRRKYRLHRSDEL